MTTAPATDERAHATAIRDAVNTHLIDSGAEDDTRCYDSDAVPGTKHADDEDARRAPLPDIFLQVYVERRYAPPQRMAGAKAGRSSWRVTVRGVGRNFDEARWALLRVTEALEERRLVIDGRTTTGLVHESSTAVEPDDKRWSGSRTWTYSA